MQEKLTFFQKRKIVRTLVARMRAKGHNQSQAADACGVDQSLVNRVIHFDFDRFSPRLENVCSYAGLSRIDVLDHQPRAKEELILAVGRLWDGTARGEKLLRRLLRAVERSVLEQQARGLEP